MRNCLVIIILSINVIFSYAQVNDSIVNAFCDRYQNMDSTEYKNSITEANDSLYLIVIRDLCDDLLNRSTKEDTLYVLFNDIVFKNYLYVENELNTMQVSDRLPNINTTVYTINQALVDGDLCFISVAISSMDLSKKLLNTSEFIYYIFRKKGMKWFYEKKVESSF